MATTIEQFVKAFIGKVSNDAFTARDKKVEAALKLLKAKVADLEKAGAPLDGFKQGLVALVARYDAARKQSTSPKQYVYDELLRILGEATAQTAVVAKTLAQVAEYDQQKKTAEAAVDKLEKLKNADAVDKEFRNAKYDLATAEGLAQGARYAEAVQLLKVVIDDCATADTKARILKGDAPKKADFEALMKRSGGAKRLDKLILALPDDCSRRSSPPPSPPALDSGSRSTKQPSSATRTAALCTTRMTSPSSWRNGSGKGRTNPNRTSR